MWSGLRRDGRGVHKIAGSGKHGGHFRQISQKFPENFKEDRGASMDNIVDVLRYRGIHCYDNHDYGAGGVWPYLYGYAKDTSPVIVYISWGTGQGAHATLCVYVYKSDQKCVFLDPAYGLVELAGSQLPAYLPTDNTGIYGGAVMAGARDLFRPPRPLVDQHLGEGDLPADATGRWLYIKTVTFGEFL